MERVPQPCLGNTLKSWFLTHDPQVLGWSSKIHKIRTPDFVFLMHWQPTAAWNFIVAVVFHHLLGKTWCDFLKNPLREVEKWISWANSRYHSAFKYRTIFYFHVEKMKENVWLLQPNPTLLFIICWSFCGKMGPSSGHLLITKHSLDMVWRYDMSTCSNWQSTKNSDDSERGQYLTSCSKLSSKIKHLKKMLLELWKNICTHKKWTNTVIGMNPKWYGMICNFYYQLNCLLLLWFSPWLATSNLQRQTPQLRTSDWASALVKLPVAGLQGETVIQRIHGSWNLVAIHLPSPSLTWNLKNDGFQ